MAERVSNAEVVRRVLDLFSGGDVQGGLEYIDEDFVGVVGPEVSTEPDTYSGHEGVRRYFAAYLGVMEDVRFELVDVTDHGDSVIVEAIIWGRGAASGIEVSLPGASTWDLRDGRVTRMEAFADMEAARAALADNY